LRGFGVYILVHKNLSYATHTGVFEADKDKRALSKEEKNTTDWWRRERCGGV